MAELKKVFLSRGILQKSDKGLEVASDLVIEVHYPGNVKAQVNISKAESSTEILTYLLVKDGGFWRITHIAEPIPVIPNREIIVPQDKLWND